MIFVLFVLSHTCLEIIVFSSSSPAEIGIPGTTNTPTDIWSIGEVVSISPKTREIIELARTQPLRGAYSRILNHAIIRPIPSITMASPKMNGMTDDVSTGVKKQVMPARIISIPRITNRVFLAVITNISLPRKTLLWFIRLYPDEKTSFSALHSSSQQIP